MATSIQITFDSANPEMLAGFWAAALGYVEQPPPAGYDDWNTFLVQHDMGARIGAASAIIDPAGVGPRVFFQRVPEPKTAKNRMHLDLNVSEKHRVGIEEGRRRIATEVERLVGLGATKVGAYDQDGEVWTVMTDPESNEFCVQ